MPHARRLRLCVAVAFCLSGTTLAATAHPFLPAPESGATTTRVDALARAAEARDQQRWLDALAIYERLAAEAPQDPEIHRLRTLTLADLGSAGRAWELLQARPELFSDAERNRLEADHVARLAVWGGTRPLDESRRLQDMQRAADAAAAVADPADLRHRFDRLVILNGLEQHEQAAALYRSLRAEGREIPPYALAAAGDSLLASRHPEEAVEALEGAVAALPDDIDTQVVLAYAYLESERHADARAHLERLVEAEPAWTGEPGARNPEQNWARYSAETALAMIRAYSRDPAAAQSMLAPMAAVAPNNADLQAKLGIVRMQRERPEAALQRFGIAHTQDPRNLEARIGRVEALAELGRMRRAREAHDALLATWPDNVHARRLHRQWRSRTGWQIEASVHRGRGDSDDAIASASPLGSRDGGHALSVYSPLLGDRWRVGAFRQEQWAEFDDAPRVRDLRHGVGLRYQYDRLQLDLHAARSDDRRDGAGANDATAVGMQAQWRFSDALHGRLEAGHNSADASLQARAAGILADSVAIGLDWIADERGGLGGELRHWRYDDGNERLVLALQGHRQVLVRPRLSLELNGGVHAGRGSRDDAPYFNPSRDAGWNAGALLETTHWRRYERSFSQQFGAGIGQYWQQEHGSTMVPSLQYRHRWTFDHGRSLDYGVSWSRPAYDGVRERYLAFDLRLRWGN